MRTGLIVIVMCGAACRGDDGEGVAIPDGAVAAERIDGDGGELRVTNTGTVLDGARIVVPAGAVDDTTTFAIGIARPEGVAGVDEPADIALDAFMLFDDQGEVLTHPLLGAAVFASSTHEALGPAISLEPSGTSFSVPIEVRLPAAPTGYDDEVDAVLLSAALAASLDGDRIAGSRTRAYYDAESDELVAVIEHFSTLQWLRGNLEWLGGAAIEAGRRVANIARRASRDLPEVQSFLVPFLQEVVCQPDIEPKVDQRFFPTSPSLLYYLSTPVVPDGQSDREAMLDLEFDFLLTGRETELENWIIDQPPASVSLAALFGEAYRLARGDVFLALLTSHNALRGWDGANRRAAGERGGPIQSAMMPLTGGSRAAAHEAGDRYHVFGLATFAFLARVHVNYDWVSLIPDGAESPFLSTSIYVEECLVSGDCLTDEIEFAYDLEGKQLGFELADALLDERQGTSLIEGRDWRELVEEYDLDTSCRFAVRIEGETTYAVGQNAELMAVAEGGEEPIGFEWLVDNEVVATGPELLYPLEEAGEILVTLVGRDGTLLEADASARLLVGDTAGEFCPSLMPTSNGALPLTRESPPRLDRGGHYMSATCGYGEGDQGSSFSVRFHVTPGPVESSACWTDRPISPSALCSTQGKQAAVGVASPDDGFEDEAEAMFAETLLRLVEAEAIDCPPRVYDTTSSCTTGRIECPLTMPITSEREMSLMYSSETCPTESFPGAFFATCNYHLVECSPFGGHDPNARGEDTYQVAWAEDQQIDPSDRLQFHCQEEEGIRFGAVVWHSGSQRSHVVYIAGTPTPEQATFAIELRDSIAGPRAAMCPPP